MHRCSGMSRRRFLAQAGRAAGAAALWGASGGALLGASASAFAQGGADARVGIGRNPAIWSDQDGVNYDVLAQVVDNTLMWFTGEDSAEKAWGSLFSSDEVVGLKPNGLGGLSLATSRQMSEYCVERLTGIGVKRENIIIWEQTPGFLANCGIDPSDIPWGVRAAVTSDAPGAEFHHGTVHDTLTAVVTDYVDAFVNLPILKDHGISGVTLSMKNHYGTLLHPGNHHNNTREQIADLASIPVIKDKSRLILCDMTHCVVEGGPGGDPHFFPNAIMVATDMVAHDTVGASIIDEERVRRGMRALTEIGRTPEHIQVAAERGVGVGDVNRIEVKVVE